MVFIVDKHRFKIHNIPLYSCRSAPIWHLWDYRKRGACRVPRHCDVGGQHNCRNERARIPSLLDLASNDQTDIIFVNLSNRPGIRREFEPEFYVATSMSLLCGDCRTWGVNVVGSCWRRGFGVMKDLSCAQAEEACPLHWQVTHTHVDPCFQRAHSGSRQQFAGVQQKICVASVGESRNLERCAGLAA